MVSNASIFLLASILIFQMYRHVLSGQEEVMTPFMLLPMGNHPTATELVDCHSYTIDPTLTASGP